MKLYSLSEGGETICRVDSDVPRWFPLRPVLRRLSLRQIVRDALRRYLATKAAKLPTLA